MRCCLIFIQANDMIIENKESFKDISEFNSEKFRFAYLHTPIPNSEYHKRILFLKQGGKHYGK